MDKQNEWVERIIRPADRPELARPYNINGAHVASDGFRLHAAEADRPGDDECPVSFEDMLVEVAGRETVAKFAVNGGFLRDALPETGAVHLRLVDGALEVYWRDEGDHRYACIATMRMGVGYGDAEIHWRPLGDAALRKAKGDAP